VPAYLLLCLLLIAGASAGDIAQYGIPILAYHRFGPTVSDRMTVTITVFESHLKFLKENGYEVITLRQWIQSRLTGAPPLPARSVIITADDNHRSVYAYMLPLVQRYRVPVTLFVYPSAISNADYALTWEQLEKLAETGFFNVQSHTYWHPNFKVEKQRLTHDEYLRFVDTQLTKSRAILEQKLRTRVDMLAWPFGIYDDELIGKAVKAGYIAAFTIEGRHATPRDHIMALPRYLMSQGYQGKGFVDLLAGNVSPPGNGY
jgi:peptidoglycan/xylan/chitin deacetylase (PgdA/CDA1 family)